MKIKKDERRKLVSSVRDAQYKITRLQEDHFMKQAQQDDLEEVYTLLTRIGARLEGKHGKR